jgi:hypothetical protein
MVTNGVSNGFRPCRYLILLVIPALLAAQQRSDLQQILDRLDKLEQENRDLVSEIRLLRSELGGPRAAAPADQNAPSTSPIEERVAVAEQRIEEQAQTKVEASQRLPITLTGMVLFNAFLNGRASGGQQNPTSASPSDTLGQGGASLRQSVLGLKFQGPKVWGGGQVNGAMYMDFFAGSTSSLNHLVRLRIATLEINWKNTSIMAGQDKPIISPREPNSLAQVGVSPLTSAGNLWLWQPQVRFEQRFSLGEQTGLRAQLGVYQTSEPSYISRGGDDPSNPVSPSRPGLQGRFELWRQIGSGTRIEIAPGFHYSQSRVNGNTIPSDLFSVDWLIQPVSKVQITGMFFQGQNSAAVSGLHQGFTVFPNDRVVPVGAAGGWTQLSLLATKRLSFNMYGGQESNRAQDLLRGDISRNLMYAGNAIYRLGSNVLIGLEASQVRTNYLRLPARLNNHYDLAFGYLF